MDLTFFSLWWMSNLKMNLAFLSVLFLKLHWFKTPVSGPVVRKLELRTAWLPWNKVCVWRSGFSEDRWLGSLHRTLYSSWVCTLFLQRLPFARRQKGQGEEGSRRNFVSVGFSLVEACLGNFGRDFGQLPSDSGAFGLFALHSRLLSPSLDEGLWVKEHYLAQNRCSQEEKEELKLPKVISFVPFIQECKIWS